MQKQPVIKLLLFVYFVLNIAARWNIVFGVNELVTWFVGAVALIFLVFAVFSPRYIKYILFLFAFSFPLYGTPPLFTRAHVFEFLLCVQSFSLLIVAVRNDSLVIRDCMINRLLGIYLLYSCFSLLLLPAYEYSLFFNFDTLRSATEHLLYENTWSFLYSIAGLNRLGLFIASVILISCLDEARGVFKVIFISMFVGAVLSAAAGILHQFGFVSLELYSYHSGRPGLQSVFSHPAGFSGYMNVTIPFILYGFLKKERSRALTIGLFAIIILCEVAIIFSASRTSWLTYPITLLVCWTCFYWQQNIGATWRNKLIIWSKIAFSLPVTIVLSVLVVYSAATLFNEFSSTRSKQAEGTEIGTGDVEKRLSKLFSPSFRAAIGKETLYLIRESPLVGLGYESYSWHATIMSKINDSKLSQHRKTRSLYATPHNFYLSLLVNGGIIGLFLWLSLISCTCIVLIVDVLKNKNVCNIPVLVSIFAFHQHGMGQSPQGLPLLWFTIFLCFGYASVIMEKELFDSKRKLMNRFVLLCGILALLGGAMYTTNYQSWRLAEKYGLPQYSSPTDPDQIHYAGFYTPVKRPPIGMIRWMGKRGSIEIVNDGMMELNIVCIHPDIKEKPVTVSIDIDGQMIDEVVFLGRDIKKRQYYVPESVVGRRLNINVSRTWNPQKFGGKWGRIQGVAVSTPLYFSEVPRDGIGFFAWEKMVGQLPSWAQFDQPYRWSGKSAAIPVDDKMQKHDFEIYLRSNHPDIIQKPVEVELFADDDFLETVILTSPNWQPLVIGQEKLAGKKALTFHVSRTWNPALMKISGDNRNLGIAVAVP